VKETCKNEKQIRLEERKLEITYPNFSLRALGHTLAGCLNIKTIDKIIENITCQNLEAIPFDLAKIFFDLNAKVINIDHWKRRIGEAG
jgi:hypothetical protein